MLCLSVIPVLHWDASHWRLASFWGAWEGSLAPYRASLQELLRLFAGTFGTVCRDFWITISLAPVGTLSGLFAGTFGLGIPLLWGRLGQSSHWPLRRKTIVSSGAEPLSECPEAGPGPAGVCFWRHICARRPRIGEAKPLPVSFDIRYSETETGLKKKSWNLVKFLWRSFMLAS